MQKKSSRDELLDHPSKKYIGKVVLIVTKDGYQYEGKLKSINKTVEFLSIEEAKGYYADGFPRMNFPYTTFTFMLKELEGVFIKKESDIKPMTREESEKKDGLWDINDGEIQIVKILNPYNYRNGKNKGKKTAKEDESK